MLQEFDLPPGETLLGRSPDCHITIEDPLISRQHARIVVQRESVTFYDLGSRNGSKVNGEPVYDSQPLHDKDRVRLGTQELVFIRVGVDQRNARSTGAMRLCHRCKTPFSEGPASCPHCGHSVTSVNEEDTFSGINVPVQRKWILQMYGEYLDRALVAGQVSEAERVLRRAAEEAENRIASGELDTAQLSRIAVYALQVSQLRGDSQWVLWVLDTHRRLVKVPEAVLIPHLQGSMKIVGVPAALTEYLRDWDRRGIPVSEVDAPQLAALEQMAER